MISAKWIEDGNFTDSDYIRRKVFVEEQGISEAEEMDGTDRLSRILVLYENDKPVATGRLIKVLDMMFIGRVAVLKEKRGQRLGDFIVRLLIRRAVETGENRVFVHAQIQAQGFYAKLGFIERGEHSWEAGIEHVLMSRDGDITGGDCL